MTATPDAIDFAQQFGFSAGYVEKIYADWQEEPQSVAEEWRRFFEQHGGNGAGPAPAAAAPSKGADTQPADTQPAAAAPPTEARPATKGKKGAGKETADAELEPIRGVASRIASNMAQSLEVPTATSTREIPVKVLDENRRIINHHLAKDFRGKVSFTHLVAWALVLAVRERPAMTVSFETANGKPHRRVPEQVNLGIAIDLPGPGGQRSLVVPNLKNVTAMDFSGFLAAFNDVVRRGRDGKLGPDDFRGTTFTLTNPGMIGTVSSLPRLMVGQSFILATGAIAAPAAYEGASPATLSELGISKVMAVTSTYDHRVIQGAESGELLARIHTLLTGEHGFYDQIFAGLKIPHQPLRFLRDRRAPPGSPMREAENMERAAKALQWIRAYRVRGYLLADIDPLHYDAPIFPELEMSTYGLTIWDLDRDFFTGGATGKPIAKLREIRETLEETYCGHIGVEYMHIADPEQKEWLRQRMEGNRNQEELPKERMLRVLDKLVEAEAFERFLHTRFVGHKRFSIEGGETLIPALNALLIRASEVGVERVVMGMAHRGRLNVLAHLMGKDLTRIFSEFEGYIDPELSQGSGDVKYHLGARANFVTPDGAELALELASNPSHLEAVGPVVEGMARARQVTPDGVQDRHRTLALVVHGDAAFAGQGVVAETLNMSQLPGYRTGGTIHLIVNNQIGYTTLPSDARSTPYCTDIAKAIQAPIFHVNGDDPLAAVRMVRLAMEYRQKFERDVVVDLVCYRRLGHNEGDEPSFTQPLLYREIEQHPSVREIYQDYLLRAKVLEREEAEAFDRSLNERLRAALEEVRSSSPPEVEIRETPEPDAWDSDVATAVPMESLRAWADRLLTIPEGFSPHPKILKLFDRRRQMVAGDYPVDFGFGETLAYASLVTHAVPVRLAGQDSGRGTFSHRHAVLIDCETGDRHIPLQYLQEGQAHFLVVDSLLSEEAALGFEYGYDVTTPEGLTLWEAQFGDFCNGAQIQIDQFIAAGEAKWRQSCALTLLLPHGYDGQGPEHSSARLERFLQLCAEGNMRVANPTTPAQYFHLLRRQALDLRRKPLIVMTTKSLLRQRVAGSSIEEFATERFAPVLPDPEVEAERVERVVLCSGKIYYELLAERREQRVEQTALVRVEQLYPWPAAAVNDALGRYPNAGDVIWCQEEPANMGAWSHVREYMDGLTYVGRKPCASPATGSLHLHKVWQTEIVRQALGLGEDA
ncbi:MAG: multifunctional oxoglutarate decarboxylase/oxoglutarate dehydrogenase thiamine pyrophosphate-binding subunit/dihydrolipoyllysine-residue succinyltransferase subunit [Planctomycetota bacterium]